MKPSDDPFDARPTAELLATDALLDRVGARAPTPDDLDDPLVAALALMAAEIDLDGVPVERTRTALARVRPEPDVTELDVPDAPLAGERTGLVVDLTGVPTATRSGTELRQPRRRRPQPGQPATGPVAMAPPRSLPRVPTSTGPGGSRRPDGRREHKLRPMVAVAVVITAFVLGSGVSAAITGGRSVNPLDGIQQVVADLTGGRTDDQRAALDEANAHLKAAADDPANAKKELDALTPQLLARLTQEDRKVILNRKSDLLKKLK